MRKTITLRLPHIVLLSLILTLVISNSCTKSPEPGFSFEPAVNPEAGDTIRFINSSSEATSYDWDFGDSESSGLEEPEHIYALAGTYEVSLTATNDKESQKLTKALQINEPTILDIQIFGLAEDTSVLEGAEVWIYDDEDSFRNFPESPPDFYGITDSDGIVIFYNLEAISYYVVTVKLEEFGVWLSAFLLNPLQQNMANLLALPSEFLPYDDSASSKSAPKIEYFQRPPDFLKR